MTERLVAPSVTSPTVMAKTLLVMKLTLVLLTAAILNVSANGFSQNVTFSGENVSLSAVFTSIKKQTGYVFLYGASDLNNTNSISISVKEMPLEQFLKEIFKMQPLDYTIAGKNIMVSRKTGASIINRNNFPELWSDSVPKIQLKGKVMNSNGQILTNATVRVKGSKQTTMSNSMGEFELTCNMGSVLVVSYVGHEIYEEVVRSNKHISIVLELNAELDEAVVYNGFQKIKQKYLTGSVTSLRMDSIMQPGLNTIDKMLEGRVPGMLFMQNSGQAGAAPQLRVRGTNTYLGSREPLWVVDGIIRTNPIPISADRINDPDFVNLLGNAISGLNPNDIEQIDVLKDAAAAAIYGVRGANGVIVVTTKRGKPGPPTVNYNVTGTYTRRPRYTDRSVFMMNSKERVDVSREMIDRQLALRGGEVEAYERAIAQYYNSEIEFETFRSLVNRAETVNTDWLGNVMQDVLANNHTLSVSGGTAAVSYRASVGYRSEPGVIKKEKNDLYTGTMNLQMNYRRFKVDMNIQLNKEQRSYTPAEIGVLNYAYGTSRAIPLRNDDGSLYYYSTMPSGLNTSFKDLRTMNIVNEMEKTGERIENVESNGSLDLSYEIAKGVQLRSRIAFTGGNSQRDIWFDQHTQWATQVRYNAWLPSNGGTFSVNADALPFGGELRKKTVARHNYLISNRLQISKFLDQQNRHQVSTDIAIDIMSNKSTDFNLTSRGYYPDRGNSFANIAIASYPAYARWIAAQGQPSIGIQLNNSIRPYVTSTYVYKDRYVITGTASQEFSNSFGERSNERFFPTWSLSGRWNIHEDILRNKAWIDHLSLLLSFGTRGNMLPGQTINTVITKGVTNTIFNANSSTVTYFRNPDLAWEQTKDYNGSLQFSLLNGKMRGSLGYFYTRTSNAFMNLKVSAINGAPNNSYVVNGGVLENQGVEISLNFKVLDNLGAGKRRIMWRIDPQLGQVFNKLINRGLNSRNVLVDAASLTYHNFLSGSVPVNGKSVNTFYSYQFKTLDPQLGFPIFYGAELDNSMALTTEYNKLPKEEVYNKVLVESGRREPVLQGGVSNSFNYGNWGLNVMLTYSIGNKVRLMQIASGNYGTYRPSSQQNIRKEFTNRWRYPGDELFTNVPAVQGGEVINSVHYAWWIAPSTRLTYPIADDYYSMYDFSDIRVVKGDYLKMQSLSLSYRLSPRLCKQIGVKGVMTSLNGSNLFTIANRRLRGQDPSQSGFAANINLSIRPVYSFNLNLSL